MLVRGTQPSPWHTTFPPRAPAHGYLTYSQACHAASHWLSDSRLALSAKAMQDANHACNTRVLRPDHSQHMMCGESNSGVLRDTVAVLLVPLLDTLMLPAGKH